MVIKARFGDVFSNCIPVLIRLWNTDIAVRSNVMISAFGRPGPARKQPARWMRRGYGSDAHLFKESSPGGDLPRAFPIGWFAHSKFSGFARIRASRSRFA